MAGLLVGITIVRAVRASMPNNRAPYLNTYEHLLPNAEYISKGQWSSDDNDHKNNNSQNVKLTEKCSCN